MGQVHFEDVEGGREGCLVAFGKQEGLEAVDRLGNGSDGDLVSVALKNVEGNGGEQRIAHGGLLRDVVLGTESGVLVVPGSPLVDDELHVGLAGTLWLAGHIAHGSPVVGDNFFHERAAGKQVVVLIVSKVKRIALGKFLRAA